MEFRLHGANPEKLYEQFNIKKPERIIDFSTNTNVIKASEYEMNFHQLAAVYPDDECIELRQIIAKQENLTIDNILISNGINEIIYLLASLYSNKRVGLLTPTYSEYRQALEAYDAELVSFQRIDDIADVDMVFLCNPNNPTGDFLDNSKVSKLASRLNKKGIKLVIDESYYQFLDHEHKLIDVEKYKNVIVMRSLTKFYHLSGLRIGYTTSCQENIEMLKRRQPTWSVNGIALEYSRQCLADLEFHKQTKEFYQKEVGSLINQIKKIGYIVEETSVNFFLIKVNNDLELIKFLLGKGIVVRHTRNYEELNGGYIRVACKLPEENEYLIEALKEYKDENYTN